MALSNEAIAFLLVCGAGMSTCIGAAVVYSETLVQMTSKTILAAGLGTATGVMLFVSFMEIAMKSEEGFLDQGYSESDAKLYSYLCFFGGFVSMYGLDYLVHLIDPGERHCVCGENLDLESFIAALSQDQRDRLENLKETQSIDDLVLELKNLGGDKSVLESLGNVSSSEKLLEILAGHHHRNHSDGSNNSSNNNSSNNNNNDGSSSSYPTGYTHGGLVDEEGKENASGTTPTSSLENFKQIKLKKMGVMTALAIALHNLPEGLATFVAAMDDPAVGAALAVAIALHNIPEGICVSVPIYFSTGNRHKAFLWAFLSGVSELIGAALGWIILATAMNDLVYGILFGLVAGMMVYICIYQLLPTAHRYDPEDKYVSSSCLFGMGVMAASLVMFLY